MRIFAVLLVLVPVTVGAVTVEELQKEMKQKDLQHEQELAKMNDIISVLQVHSTSEFILCKQTVNK